VGVSFVVGMITVVLAGVLGWYGFNSWQVQVPGSSPRSVATGGVSRLGGERLLIPAVGLDVPLGEMEGAGGVITPPGAVAAYWVRNIGASLNAPQKGTVFVAMHAVMGGGVGPGNFVIDEDRAASRVPVGSVVAVAGVHYRVTGSLEVARGRLAAARSVWANTPDRLVIITCLLTPGDNEPIDNLIITATREV